VELDPIGDAIGDSIAPGGLDGITGLIPRPPDVDADDAVRALRRGCRPPAIEARSLWAGASTRVLVASTRRRGRLLVRKPPLRLQYSPQHELDLPVQAAQLIVGPLLKRIEDRWIDS
jgi:hypothetical protein